MRESGILMPVFSLPGEEGIGCFSKEARDFVDFLAAAGQRYWQILPLGPTSYGDSPYQSFSTFAGNPYFISLKTLEEEGLLKADEWHVDFGGSVNDIDYGRLYQVRYDILRKAFDRFCKILEDNKSDSGRGRKKKDPTSGYSAFVKANKEWLHDYALFMAIKDAHDGVSFQEWKSEYRLRNKKALAEFEKKHDKEIRFYEFLQYEFAVQWKALKKYANKKGIDIIGDIPIYVAADSADVWCHPELFQMKKDGSGPKAVAGCPPDFFAETGQLWGNPLYNWPYHKKTGYAWWISRMRKCMELYDVIRIDHFRGFDEYWSVPAKDKTAAGGKWKKGPGINLFKAIHKALGDIRIIAEDLGFMTDTVRELVAASGYPNMKIMQFGFDGRNLTGKKRGQKTNEYLPFNQDKNCVVYTGTHDNETMAGIIANYNDKQLAEMCALLDVKDPKKTSIKKLTKKVVKYTLSCPGNMAIIPLQDYLGLDNSARINTPSTLGCNWRWRVSPDAMTDKLAKQILKWNVLYGRA